MEICKRYWDIGSKGRWCSSKKEGILPALKIYQRLPSHFKRCFLYCSFFPAKPYKFIDFFLVQFWIAHGFVQSSTKLISKCFFFKMLMMSLLWCSLKSDYSRNDLNSFKDPTCIFLHWALSLNESDSLP